MDNTKQMAVRDVPGREIQIMGSPGVKGIVLGKMANVDQVDFNT